MLLADFLKHYPRVQTLILDCCQRFVPAPFFESLRRDLTTMLDHTVLGGKHKRGLLLVNVYEALKQDHCSTADMELACNCGWALEIMQAFFLVADDIMDASLTRRGKPCWHQMPKIGMRAVNDTLFMENSVDTFLDEILKDHPNHESCLREVRMTKMATTMGQYLDLQTPENVSLYTNRERYALLVEQKTSCYSFYLPLSLAFLLACDLNGSARSCIKRFSSEAGYFFQAQDDFLDCFGDPELSGKIGTDIEDAKCSWLLVEALDLCSQQPDLRKSLLDNYGKQDPDSVQKVKSIYSSLNLQEVFAEFEKKQFSIAMDCAKDFTSFGLFPVLSQLLTDLFQRKR